MSVQYCSLNGKYYAVIAPQTQRLINEYVEVCRTQKLVEDGCLFTTGASCGIGMVYPISFVVTCLGGTCLTMLSDEYILTANAIVDLLEEQLASAPTVSEACDPVHLLRLPVTN
jgi:hypothetical protein